MSPTTNQTSTLVVRVYDGTRQPFVSGTDILYRVSDGNQNQLLNKDIFSSNITLNALPFYDNAGDNYTVLVSSKGYKDAGFYPVMLSPQQPVTLDLMLVPSDPQMNFA